MSSVVIELPYEAGIAGECFWRCEIEGVVVAPEATGAAEGGQAGGGGEAGAAEGEDAGGLFEVGGEGGEVWLGDCWTGCRAHGA